MVRDGDPVLADFGAARADEDVRLTQTGELLGTPAYMAPEQIRGQAQEAGPKADVYAMGVILHELLSGKLPFEAGTFIELSSQVLNDPAPALPGFDPDLEDLVRRCLSKDPAGRPGAEELARELERWAPRRRARWAVPLALLGTLAGAISWVAASPAAEPAVEGEMVRIPAGTYFTGDPRFGRQVVHSPGFWIDRDEAGARASGYTYMEALSFCLRQGKRLPTEEEWEIAGGGELFPWGNEPDPSRASCQGVREPNPRDASRFGVLNLAGHVAEWTATPGRLGDEYRAVRGGHSLRPIEECTLFERQEVPLHRRPPTVGFRCASSASPGPRP